MALQTQVSKFLLTTPVMFLWIVVGIAGAAMKEAVFLEKMSAAFGRI